MGFGESVIRWGLEKAFSWQRCNEVILEVIVLQSHPSIHLPICFRCREQRSRKSSRPSNRLPLSEFVGVVLGSSLPPAGGDGEALEAPERRVVPRARASSPGRVPGHGGARGRPAVLGASRVVEPLRGGRAPTAATAARDPPAVLVTAVPRRGRPAGRSRGHFR